MGKIMLKERQYNPDTFRYFTLYSIYNGQRCMWRNWKTLRYYKRRKHARKFAKR